MPATARFALYATRVCNPRLASAIRLREDIDQNIAELPLNYSGSELLRLAGKLATARAVPQKISREMKEPFHAAGVNPLWPFAGAGKFIAVEAGVLETRCSSRSGGPREQVARESAEGDRLRQSPTLSNNPAAIRLAPRQTIFPRPQLNVRMGCKCAQVQARTTKNSLKNKTFLILEIVSERADVFASQPSDKMT